MISRFRQARAWFSTWHPVVNWRTSIWGLSCCGAIIADHPDDPWSWVKGVCIACMGLCAKDGSNLPGARTGCTIVWGPCTPTAPAIDGPEVAP